MYFDCYRQSTLFPPPPDSLYADPKSIEHQAAPGTEAQYAIVNKKGKKNTKPKPTPPEAVYQVCVKYLLYHTRVDTRGFHNVGTCKLLTLYMYVYLLTVSLCEPICEYCALVITPCCYFSIHYQFRSPIQDPSTIEHETAASKVMYTVVDKPKRSSKKKEGPDVVPPASEWVSGRVLVLQYTVIIFVVYIAVNKKFLYRFRSTCVVPFSAYYKN